MWNFFIEKHRFTVILMLGLLLFGALSMFSIPREASPEVKVPYASVVTIYPGASPLDVEELISVPLETAISGLDQVKNMNSTSSEGFSSIFVEFESDADIKDRVNALQTAINGASSSLPNEVEDPIVSELNFSNQPILTLSLNGNLSPKEMREITETIEAKIMEVNNVSKVDISGLPKEHIYIELDPVQMEHHSISHFEVLQALQSAKSNLPLGTLEASGSQYSFGFSDMFSMESLAFLQIRNLNGVPIYLKDLGTIEREIPKQSQMSRSSSNGGESENAVSIQVYKKTGGDIVKIVDDVRAGIEDLDPQIMSNVELLTSVDGANDIRDQLEDLGISGLQTIVLVFLILFVFLGFREAFLAGLSIPLTFMISFIGLSFLGETLNFLSLFSLILALGILVDTGIVIVEGMHTKIAAGNDLKSSAIQTVEEYKWPLISGTMTTVAAFLPMLFMSGIIGGFVRHIPITIITTLIASLFVGLGFLPLLGVFLLKKKKPETKKRFFEKQFDNLNEKYKNILAYFLAKKSRQNLFLGGMLILFLISLALPISGILKANLFPAEDYYLFNISVELPKGSPIEASDAAVKDVEKALYEIPEIESFVVNIGSSGPSADGLSTFSASSSHLSNFSVILKDDRERSSLDIVAYLQEEFKNYTEAKVEISGVASGPPGAAPVAFTIYGEDLEELQNLAKTASKNLSEIDGTQNVRSSIDDLSPEFIFEANHNRIHQAGLSASVLAQNARIAISGMNVGSIKLDGEDLDIFMRTKDHSKLNDVLAIPIQGANGQSYPLSYFGEIKFSNAPNVILRENGERGVTIESDLRAGILPNDVLEKFRASYNPEMSTGTRIEYGGEAEETAESFASLGRAMLLGILLILIILLIQFNSFRQSLIILFTIPLALIGVFFGLTILGLTFSFPAFIGVVALAGIVVNNAIILMDRINSNIALKIPQTDAILEAGSSRLQAILLTSITTISGMLPLALSDPSWGPLGFSIISGLLFSTILTLLTVPIAYARLS